MKQKQEKLISLALLISTCSYLNFGNSPESNDNSKNTQTWFQAFICHEVQSKIILVAKAFVK
jgi:hypothetical protein